MTASPRSPSPSQAPSGTVRASSASGIEKIDRRLRLGHEDSIHQTGPLCDLYDWVMRFNARGAAGLLDGKSLGQPSKLNDVQRQAIVRMIESGPIPAIHGVVRWRLNCLGRGASAPDSAIV